MYVSMNIPSRGQPREVRQRASLDIVELLSRHTEFGVRRILAQFPEQNIHDISITRGGKETRLIMRLLHTQEHQGSISWPSVRYEVTKNVRTLGEPTDWNMCNQSFTSFQEATSLFNFHADILRVQLGWESMPTMTATVWATALDSTPAAEPVTDEFDNYSEEDLPDL